MTIFFRSIMPCMAFLFLFYSSLLMATTLELSMKKENLKLENNIRSIGAIGQTVSFLDTQLTINQQSGEKSVDLYVQLDGDVKNEFEVELNCFGTAIEGKDYFFEKNKSVFTLGNGVKTDSIRVIAINNSMPQMNLQASFDLISNSTLVKVTPKGFQANIIIIPPKFEITTSSVGFTTIEPLFSATSSGLIPMAINAKGATTVFVDITGAKAIKDIQLLNDSKKTVGYVKGSGFKLDVLNDCAFFYVDVVSVDFVKPNKMKNVNLIIKKVTSNSSINISSFANKRLIAFYNKAPIANPDNLNIILGDLQNRYVLEVLLNDQAFDEDNLSDLYLRGVRNDMSKSDFTASILTPNDATVSLLSDKQIIYIPNPNKMVNSGYFETFEYQVAQKDGGVATALVSIYVGEGQVAGSKFIINNTFTEKRPSFYGYYDDPNTKDGKKAQKKVVFKLEKNAITADTLLISLNNTIRAYQVKLLNMTRNKGIFFADLRKDSQGNIYTATVKSGDFYNIDREDFNCVQKQNVGVLLFAKSQKNLLKTINVVSADSLRFADSALIYNSLGELKAVNYPVNKIYNAKKKHTEIRSLTFAGNYFGMAPKLYFEYMDSKGRIQRISLARKNSIHFYTSDGLPYTLTRPKSAIIAGRNSEVYTSWPTKIEKEKARGVTRFDLIIDNGSMLTVYPNFDVDFVINYPYYSEQ